MQNKKNCDCVGNHSPQEACGITAIFSKKADIISHLLVSMQDALQHRGRDAAGIAAFNKQTKKIHVYKALGRVKEVFPDGFNFDAYGLLGDAAIGHNRYGTSGGGEKDSLTGAQPIIVNWHGRTIAIAYNGNLPESERVKLRKKIPADLHIGPNFDTWDIARAIVSAKGNTWEGRIKNGLQDISLAYALTILTDKGEVFGLVCPTGTWPLWAGENKKYIVFASETRVIKGDNIRWKKVERGELVKATLHGIIRMQIFPKKLLFRCALHDQYGARSESLMTETLTFKQFRTHLGKLLAKEFPIDADVYAGIPKSGLPTAEGYVTQLGKKLTSLITLINDTRSFIAQNDSAINSVVNGKYAIPYPKKAKGKKVMLIDDSLIRGKTAGGDVLKGVKGVVALVREAGAKEVHFAVTLPKFTKDCDMGYYIRKDSLIALVKRKDGNYDELNNKEIAKRIGANSVYFLSMGSVQNAYEWALGDKESACMRCMGGSHPLTLLMEHRTRAKRNIEQKILPVYSRSAVDNIPSIATMK